MEQFPYMKKGWKSWNFSQWKLEGSGETLEEPSCTWREPTRKLDRDFLHGPGVNTNALNWKEKGLG